MGGYSRFSFDIERYVTEGENDITVRVEDSLSKDQPRGKQRYKKESWKCWYIQTTGIWKTVWIEWVSKKYIKNIKVIQKTNIDKIKLEVETNILEKDLENIKIFTSLTKVIQNLPYMSGYCYTQLTDVQQEINGLMDAKRNYKVDPSIIKKINNKNFCKY